MDIAGKLNQTGVYWAPTGGLTGSGNVEYAVGVEVATRIDDARVLSKGRSGDNVRSEMVAYFLPASNIAEDGKLLLGLLTDLTAAQIADPALSPDAFIIRNVKPIPSLDASQTLVVAELNERGN